MRKILVFAALVSAAAFPAMAAVDVSGGHCYITTPHGDPAFRPLGRSLGDNQQQSRP